ncbi:MAG: hypothetical protein IJ409_11560 [Lachnospiraceae bacterium]|nr:hypothetical protein [Lachnospiraceae bacterium]
MKKYSRVEALKIILKRFAYRLVWFDTKMAKAFYKLPEKDIKAAVAKMIEEGTLIASGEEYILTADVDFMEL